MQVTENKQERKLTIYVDEDLHERVRIKGAPLGLPFLRLVVHVLRDWVNRPEEPEPIRVEDRNQLDHDWGREILDWMRKADKDPLRSPVVRLILMYVFNHYGSFAEFERERGGA